MPKTGTLLIELDREEINKMSYAYLKGVEALPPTVWKGPTIEWQNRENNQVTIFPKTQQGNFINIDLGGIITGLHMKFLAYKAYKD